MAFDLMKKKVSSAAAAIGAENDVQLESAHPIYKKKHDVSGEKSEPYWLLIFCRRFERDSTFQGSTRSRGAFVGTDTKKDIEEVLSTIRRFCSDRVNPSTRADFSLHLTIEATPATHPSVVVKFSSFFYLRTSNQLISSVLRVVASTLTTAFPSSHRSRA